MQTSRQEEKKQAPAQLDGVLVINKPAGMTSHDVIDRLRRKYRQKKFGHTGTLDPMASGVLVILAGRAVKLSQFLKDTDKEYIAKIQLGTSYDTDDIWGKPEAEKEIQPDFDFQAVLDTFKGPQHQKVPKTSAKKVNGKKLMEYQRKGEEVPDVYTDIEIYDIQALDPDPDIDSLEFKVDCSSGTYVRSICRDFGEKTGNLAAMSSLVRTKAGGFDLSQAQDMDDDLKVWPMETVLDMEKISYEPASDIYNGKAIKLSPDVRGDQVLILDKDQPIAVYERSEGNIFKSKRGIWA